MLRLPPSLLVRARAENPLLTYLLSTCRDLQSARNELRWLKEHVNKQAINEEKPLPLKRLKGQQQSQVESEGRNALLEKLCRARGRGKPLQYILGSEYFGALEIECREGVLIPRPETAEITTELARRLTTSPTMKSILPQRKTKRELLPALRVLDLCTGTGCMTFLFHHEIAQATKNSIPIDSLAIDISGRAIGLAKANEGRLMKDPTSAFQRCRTSKMEFMRADILRDDDEAAGSGGEGEEESMTTANVAAVVETKETPPRALGLFELLKRKGLATFDILMANPPYISPKDLLRTVARSVRNFEPWIALVPPAAGSSQDEHPDWAKMATLDDVTRADLFYPRILAIANKLNVRVVMMEVGDTAQALRVAQMAAGLGTAKSTGMWDNVEVWRDGLGAWGGEIVCENVVIDDSVGGAATQDESETLLSKVVMKGPKEATHGRAVVCWRGEGGAWMAE